MKFLSMLKDSLREAIDSMVFYVMVGLSTLVILLALTVTFTPKPGGEMVMRTAAVPLSVDLEKLRSSGDDDDDATKLIERLKKDTREVYQVTEVQPLDGSPDAVSSTFKVRVKVLPIQGLFGKPSGDADPAARIREKFGKLGDWTIAEVLDVQPVEGKKVGFVQALIAGRGGEYEVTARPTPIAIRLWPHSLSLFFGSLPLFDQEKGTPLGTQVFLIEQLLINTVGAWITILVSIVITAFFVPNMLRKGTIDMLIVKPISRPLLLIYKFLGGLSFIALNTAVAVGGVWLAFGLRSGIWAPGFLASIPVLTFFFAILYSASTLFAVLTRSPIAAILLTCLVWLFLFAVGATHSVFGFFREVDQARGPHRAAINASIVALAADPGGGGALLAASALEPEITAQLIPGGYYDSLFARFIAGLHYILPRTGDLGSLNSRLSFRELVFPVAIDPAGKNAANFSWTESLTVSAIFIAVMLGLACWRFATRDY
jgi:ABC-type transport system involved in multi-copper enzyme maturation permease subunit